MIIDVDVTYYVVELNHNLPDDVRKWLVNSFGKEGGTWWYTFKKLYFLNKHDHLLFTLRWA